MNGENEFAGAACAAYEAFLEDHIEGVLEAQNARKLSDHLKTCVRCSHALADASAASQWVRTSVEPVRQPGPAFARIVMARIRAEEENYGRVAFWGPFVSLAWKFATTAALALVVMMAYASHSGSVSPSVPSVAVVTSSSDIQDMVMPTATATAVATRTDLTQIVTGTDNAER